MPPPHAEEIADPGAAVPLRADATSNPVIPPELARYIAAEVSRAVTASIAAIIPTGRPSGPLTPALAPTELTSLDQHQLTTQPMVNATSSQGVDAAVQGSVASALQALSGESLIGVAQPESRPTNIFNSMSIPIGARLDAKIKAKIWGNVYFDFGQLLHSLPRDNKYRISISDDKGGATPSLCLEPTHKAKPIVSIEDWTNAFQVFVGVFTTKFPSEAPALMKYGEVVRDLAHRSGNWNYYDTNFRYMRQQNPSSMPWGATHWELWIRSQHLPQGEKRPTTTKPLSSSFVPRGFCRKFHSGSACSGCTYKHECHKCGAVHPANKCSLCQIERAWVVSVYRKLA